MGREDFDNSKTVSRAWVYLSPVVLLVMMVMVVNDVHRGWRWRLRGRWRCGSNGSQWETATGWHKKSTTTTKWYALRRCWRHTDMAQEKTLLVGTMLSCPKVALPAVHLGTSNCNSKRWTTRTVAGEGGVGEETEDCLCFNESITENWQWCWCRLLICNALWLLKLQHSFVCWSLQPVINGQWQWHGQLGE